MSTVDFDALETQLRASAKRLVQEARLPERLPWVSGVRVEETGPGARALIILGHVSFALEEGSSHDFCCVRWKQTIDTQTGHILVSPVPVGRITGNRAVVLSDAFLVSLGLCARTITTKFGPLEQLFPPGMDHARLRFGVMPRWGTASDVRQIRQELAQAAIR